MYTVTSSDWTLVTLKKPERGFLGGSNLRSKLLHMILCDHPLDIHWALDIGHLDIIVMEDLGQVYKLFFTISLTIIKLIHRNYNICSNSLA